MKKLLSILSMVVLIIFASLNISAHEAELDIIYDQCEEVAYVNSSNIGDGSDEMWYLLDPPSSTTFPVHIEHGEDVTTIKYFFDDFPNGTISDLWATHIKPNDEIPGIKSKLVESMKKWNNVSYYQYISSNTIVKKKIVNIIEGTEDDHNLVIYPSNGGDEYASTIVRSEYDRTLIGGEKPHYHGHQWIINFNVSTYEEADNNEKEIILEMVMAHEIGHVLGLRDIDNHVRELGDDLAYHHEEVLMGYSSGDITTRQTEITYKDIAGVAITRGYHTDDDHMWLYDASNSSTNNYKLICSICNGVRYVENLSDYTYYNYNACQSNHNLASGNMMAVASYGTKDYYKCKYCRWVAPFTSNVEQNYSIVNNENGIHHDIVNCVTGLEYIINEEHNFVNDYCDICNYHNHSYTYSYIKFNDKNHKSFCSCGDMKLMPHVFTQADLNDGNKTKTCIVCKAVFDNDSSIGIVGPLSRTVKKTINGSYVLANGIIILALEDIDAYFDDALVWYDEDTFEILDII